MATENFAYDVIERAARTPDAIALRASDQQMRYGDLRARVIRYALHMRLRGIGRGACLGLDAGRMPEGLALALAAALLGVPWVEVRPGTDLAAVGVTHVLTINPQASGRNVHIVDRDWTALPAGMGNAPIGFDGFASPSETALYVESSGTTGRPKLIARNYANLRLSIDRMRHPGQSPIHTHFSPLSSGGFVFRVSALLEGATIIVGDRTFAGLLEDGVAVVQGSPAQVEHMLRGATPGPQRLGKLISWGSDMPNRLVRHWLQFFEEVEMGYGSREASRVGVMRVRSLGENDPIEYALAPDAVVEIVDADGNSLPPGSVGDVRVRTARLAAGYVGSVESTQNSFREGWFYPGDLGMITPEGRLRVMGRTADQYNLGGVKANADDIDEAVRRADGVVTGVSFIEPSPTGLDTLAVAVVPKPGIAPADVAEAVRAACKAHLVRRITPDAVYIVDSIPLNASGKPVRRDLLQLCAGLFRY